MNATPETFKPGERWLVVQYKNIGEVQCLEWSQSGLFVKVQYARGGAPLWLSETLELLERLPDESGNHKTESKGGVEAASLLRWLKFFATLWPCVCTHCVENKSKLWTAYEKAAEVCQAHAETKA